MKKIVLILCLVLCMIGSCAAADMSYYEDVSRVVRENWRDTYVGYISIQVGSALLSTDGEDTVMNTEVKLDNGNTVVPIGDFVAPFEAEFTQSDDGFKIKQGTLTASGKAESDEIFLTFADNAELNTTVKLPAKVQNISGVLYIPVRALVEDVLAGEVNWNDATKSVVIKRDYQTKRIMAVTKNESPIIKSIKCKEKVYGGDGMWIIQFGETTPDIEVKYYCDLIESDTENVEYAHPDVISRVNF